MNDRSNLKLLNLKKWLTLPDAARHISSDCNEKVTEADILRLALDGHLKLSVYFVNQTEARRGTVVFQEDVKWGEIPRELAYKVPNLAVEAEGELLRYMKSVKIDDTRFLNLSDEETTIEGVWDLCMIGSGQLNVEEKYQTLIGGPQVIFQSWGGPVVESIDGVMYQLGGNRYANLRFSPDLMAQIAKLRRLKLSKSNNRIIEQLLALRSSRVKSLKFIELSSPSLRGLSFSDRLPKDSVLVLRSEVFSELKKFMLDNEATINTATKVHGNIERHAANREQVLGAALAVLAKWPKECMDAKGKPVASKIAAMVDQKAGLFWPNAQPPLATDSIADHIRDWIKKTNSTR